jgi:hypothetical protein
MAFPTVEIGQYDSDPYPWDKRDEPSDCPSQGGELR